MQTNWHCRWLKQETGQLFATYFCCRLYHIDFTRHCALSRLMAQQPRDTPPGSALETLRRQYARHGNAPADAEEQRPTGPVATLPDATQYSLYHLLALNGYEMERSLRRHIEDDFSIYALMQQFCERYRAQMSRTFPPLRRDLSHHTVTATKRASRHSDDEDIEVLDVLPNVNGRTQHAYDRLIPLALLPLVLDLMPGSYTYCNNIIEQCLLVRQDLLQQRALATQPVYVTEQLQLIKHNCTALAFLQQQARFQLRQSDWLMRDDLRRQHEAEQQALAEARAAELDSLHRQIENMHVAMRFLYERSQPHSDEDEKIAPDEALRAD